MHEPLIAQTKTAIESHVECVTSGQIATYDEIVLQFIKKHEPCTNNDIMRGTGLDYKLVSRARWGLIKAEKIVLLYYKKIDPITKKKNEQVAIMRNPEIAFKKKSNAEKLQEIKALCQKFYLGEKDRLCLDIISIIDKK